MSKTKPALPVPMRIRDACALAFEQTIPNMARLAMDQGGPPTAQIAAFDKLGKFGLGGRSELLFEAGDIAQVCIRQVREMFSPSDAQLRRFKNLLMQEFDEVRKAATEGGELGEPSGAEQDV